MLSSILFQIVQYISVFHILKNIFILTQFYVLHKTLFIPYVINKKHSSEQYFVNPSCEV
jgi:hypothetical protein